MKTDRNRMNKEIYTWANIPSRAQGLFLDTLQPYPGHEQEQENLRRGLKALLDGKFWCLKIFGSVGNGKTMYASAAVMYYNVERQWCGAKYITQDALANELYGSFDNDSRTSESKVVKHYSNLPFLVIDEISDKDKNWREYVKEKLERIIAARYERNLPTVLAGNITQSRFENKVEEYITSRCNEGKLVYMTGNDIRKEKNNGK